MVLEKGKVTKQALHNSFFELLKVKEYDEISVKDISDGAYTARANFYYYYKNKAEMVNAILTEILSNLKDMMHIRRDAIRSLSELNKDNLHAIIYPQVVNNIAYIQQQPLFFASGKKTYGWNFFLALRKVYYELILETVPDYIWKNNSPEFIELSCLIMARAIHGIVEELILAETFTNSIEIVDAVTGFIISGYLLIADRRRK